MRLWSLHPRYLDPSGLTAVWREALLAQKVLSGNTLGYRNHPQLTRFKSHPQPLGAIGTYLAELSREASTRGYRFDDRKIKVRTSLERIPVQVGQVLYEWDWLLQKVAQRAPARWAELIEIKDPEVHPLFIVVPGPVESWERLERRSADVH